MNGCSFSKGFFTSLIYFYFNTEIRHEVLRQVRRTILTNDSIRRSSGGETFSTRLSTFRRSITRYRRQSAGPNRRRTSTPKTTPEVWWKKCLTFLCPCLIKDSMKFDDLPDTRQQTIETNQFNDTSPATVPEVLLDDGEVGLSSPLVVQTRSSKSAIDNDGATCDTELVRNEHEQELWSDENDVTVQHSSCGELPSTSSTSMGIRLNELQRNRSNSDGYALKYISSNYFDDCQSLR